MSRELNNLLVTAARVGNLDEVKRLVSEGADPGAYNSLPLVNAAKGGYRNIVHYLLLQGARGDPYSDALNSAAVGETDGHYISLIFIVEGTMPTPDALSTALYRAAWHGNLRAVKYLISKGADVNAYGGDALISAARSGDLSMLAFLDSVGGNIHAKNDQAFIEAAQRGHLEVVKYLVSRGVDIHTRNDLAFIDASKRNYVDVVMYLISKGVNVRTRDDLALKEAVENPYLGMIPVFLDVGDYRGFNFPPKVREYIEEKEREKSAIRNSLSLNPVLATMIADYW